MVALGILLMAGPGAMGRLALVAGFPRSSHPLLSDQPAVQGLALFRSGDFAGADAAFAKAGSGQAFNRGLALAGMGNYTLSVAYFDAVLFANPADAEARRLRHMVADMVEPVRGDSSAPGRIAGYGGLLRPPELIYAQAGFSDPELGKPIEARGFVANEEWLRTLGDDPGEFLRLRLKAEYERRAKRGLIRPEVGDSW
jgi:Ca-activated chloride channel family protein